MSDTHTPAAANGILIGDWLPIRELGIECARESAPIPGQFPKLKTLHVWWARVPLAAASGVTLAALMPSWKPPLIDEAPGLRAALDDVREGRRDLRDADDETLYGAWLLWLTGIRADPVAARRRMDAADERGERIGGNPYGYRPAFRNNPTVEHLITLHRLLEYRWGHRPRVLDPTAGGGTLGYAALRYRLDATSNDLNPIAATLQRLCLDTATRHGSTLNEPLRKWGDELARRLEERLLPYFPEDDPDEDVANYLFANTVACPRTGGPVPLAPNWWLAKKTPKAAVTPERVWDGDQPSHLDFHVAFGDNIDFDPDDGTVRRGDAISPWDGLVIDGDHIKAEAQAGRMWPTLYAVAVRYQQGRKKVRSYRAPTQVDFDALAAVERALAEQLPAWERQGIVPTEDFPKPIQKHDIRPYGFATWQDFFSPRQLLVHGAFIEEWRRIAEEVRSSEGDDRGEAIAALLALAQGKAVNYNARLASWDDGRTKIRSVFDRHDFAFKWTFGEFEGARELWPWCVNEITDAYAEVARLLEPEGQDRAALPESRVEVTCRDAGDLAHVESGSVELVNIDPPYYDNVMYGQLADFFYVWEKRTIGTLPGFAGWFADELTDQASEAVMNPGRFDYAGKRKHDLAEFDYQQKMRAIFAGAHRVLRADGVMVVWFTHKKATAWDTLGGALMDAGFAIDASWPVATQPDSSLHHAKKNSAKSTVLLVCRKRADVGEGVFFDEIETDIRQAARSAATRFADTVGVAGVDLLLSTYGPTLSVISRNWPVLSDEAAEDGSARRLRPEEGLSVAREELARLRLARLVGSDAGFDALTDFVLLAWETFQAREFPFDDARKLAMSTNATLAELTDAKLLSAKAGTATLATPRQRRKHLQKQVEAGFASTIDVLHYLLAVVDVDGASAAGGWVAESGHDGNESLRRAAQGMLHALPMRRDKQGNYLVEEARLLATVAESGLLGELAVPPSPAEEAGPKQGTLDVDAG
jgi:adenine-specific DNA methylase